MRKLKVMSFITLDGVVQGPGGKGEDTENGFEYSGWHAPFMGDDEGFEEESAKADGLLLGRKTYDSFAAFWPTLGKDIPFWGPLMNNIPKYVASKTLKKTDWQNSTLLEGNVAEAVAKLKSAPGKDIHVIGSGNLCQTLMRHDLIDEYFLLMDPVQVGKGKRLFGENGLRRDLELLKSRVTPNGVVVLHYKVKR